MNENIDYKTLYEQAQAQLDKIAYDELEKQINIVPYIVTFFSGAFISLLIFFVSLTISNLTIVKENDLILLDEDEFYVGEVFAKGRYEDHYEYLVELYDTNDNIVIVISNDPFIVLNTEVIIYFNDGIIKMYEGGE